MKIAEQSAQLPKLPRKRRSADIAPERDSLQGRGLMWGFNLQNLGTVVVIVTDGGTIKAAHAARVAKAVEKAGNKS